MTRDRMGPLARAGAGIAIGGVLAGCEVPPYTRLYHVEAIAPSLSEEDVAALEHMGPTLADRGVNFATYSEHAERIDLLLFEDDDGEIPIQRWEMSRFGDVWNLYVEGVGDGQRYGYLAWGPNWIFDETWYCGDQAGFLQDVDSAGNRFNPNKLLTDPWGKALTRDHDWGRGSAGSGESRRTQCTWGAAAKSVVMTSRYAWGSAEDAWVDERRESGVHQDNELILYEAHPKGISANGLQGVDHPGTFRGLGEMASYWSDLGITGLELLPVHEKPADGGYWGYNNISFFAPELSYSADYQAGREPSAVVDEFKWMVERLHEQGVEVILDVVYNHTGEGGLWRDRIYTDDTFSDQAGVTQAYNLDTAESATIYNFRGLDNQAFYALSTDGLGYWNNTGVGNETRPNHVPMRRLIMDSLHYAVEELHVDGFRFDLAGILGEKDGDYNNWDDPANTVLQDIVDDLDLLDAHTRLIAEPWTAGGYYTSIGNFPASQMDEDAGWAEWNASFRDWWRSILNIDTWTMNSSENGIDGGGVITGSYARYAANGRRPVHTINYVACHDGFPLYDLFSYGQKQNECGPLNPTCCDDPTSPWCDTDSGESNNRSRDWGMDAEATKRQLMRNAFVGMMISHGTPMLHGGDEWLRTQYGNNNAYSTAADNEWNWFRWGEWQGKDERWRMHDFVRQVTRMRRDRTHAFSPRSWGGGMPFSWRNETMSGDPDWRSRRLAIHYADDGTWGKPDLLVLINMERYDVSFALPSGRSWGRLVDTQSHFDDDLVLATEGLDPRASANATVDDPVIVSGESYGVPANSLVVLEAR